MRILVTGGAGFIGSHIVDRFVADGHEVVVIDDLSTGRRENLNPKAQFFQLDIRSAQARKALKSFKPDVVNLHAAQIDLRRSVKDPLFDAQINLLGLLNLMEAAAKTNSVKQVIFASTGGAIYGEASVIPTPEDYPARPVSPYGAAKLSGEHYLHVYQEIYGIPVVSLRYANVYGPRQNPLGEAGVIAIFCHRMVEGKQAIVSGDGKQTRDYVYVGDVVEANTLVLANKIKGIYNIGTGVETDVNTLFHKLAAILAVREKSVHGPVNPGEQHRSALETRKAKLDFAWQAKTTLDEGLARTADYFKVK